MKHLKPFDAYEIAPVSQDQNGNAERWGSEADAKAEVKDLDGRLFWSLFGHLPEGGVECIADRDSYQLVAQLYCRITGLEPPHESGRWYCLPNGRVA